MTMLPFVGLIGNRTAPSGHTGAKKGNLWTITAKPGEFAKNEAAVTWLGPAPKWAAGLSGSVTLKAAFE
jgi:hypothetical protein